MGRWGSNAIERYVQDSALFLQPELAGRVTYKFDTARHPLGPASEGSSSRTSPAPVAAQTVVLDTSLFQSQLKDLESQIAGLKQPANNLIRNTDSGLVHMMNPATRKLPPRFWQTMCGWSFAFANHDTPSAEAVKVECKRCLLRTDKLASLAFLFPFKRCSARIVNIFLRANFRPSS